MVLSARDSVGVTPQDGERISLPTSSHPRVSVIIPAAAGSNLLPACLGSLVRHAPDDIPFETIVVLRDASEEAAAGLAARLDGIRLITTQANLGMAGAGNRGRSVARGELLLLLHDDAEVEQGWMEALVNAADQEPNAGAIGGKVLNLDGTLQNAGMILWSDGATSPPWTGATPPPAALSQRRAVDYCGTSSLLVRRITWDAVGGLDEQFFPAYYVDVDLCMGVRGRGQFVLYEPASRIRHRRGSSTSVRFRHFISARNREKFSVKWAAVLPSHEPREAGSPAAIERAMARSEATRNACGPIILEPPAQPRPDEDAAFHDWRHLLMERALACDYIAELASSLDGAEALADHWRETAKALKQLIDSHGNARVTFAAAALLDRANVAEPQLKRNEEVDELRRRAAKFAALEQSPLGRLYGGLLRLLKTFRIGRRGRG